MKIVICGRSVYNKDRKEWMRQVGVYLNSKKPFGLFFDEAVSTYFIDKSEMLKEFIPLVANSEDILEQGKKNKGKENKYISVTRPRRFGKTLMASMIASFFSKGKDSRKVFQRLQIAKAEDFDKHINKHNVIYITFNEIPNECKSYQNYIDRIQRRSGICLYDRDTSDCQVFQRF